MAKSRDSASDETLLARTPGDPEAFGAFYRRHAPALLGYLMRRLGDAELAADVCAETFAAALAGTRRYKRSSGPAVAWLYGIARHKLADAQRAGLAESRARERLGIPRLELTDAALERVEALADLTTTPLTKALNGLPEDQRAAVHARVVKSRSYHEIAREHSTTPANVRQRVARGLAGLRARLGGPE